MELLVEGRSGSEVGCITEAIQTKFGVNSSLNRNSHGLTRIKIIRPDYEAQVEFQTDLSLGPWVPNCNPASRWAVISYGYNKNK